MVDEKRAVFEDLVGGRILGGLRSVDFGAKRAVVAINDNLPNSFANLAFFPFLGR